jgi:hypothetical protein
LLSVRSPAEESDAVWFSPLTDPVRACRPEKALLYCVADVSATWHCRHPESEATSIEFVLSHAGVCCPPWQETLEHFPLALAGLNDVFAAPCDRYAPNTSGTLTW